MTLELKFWGIEKYEAAWQIIEEIKKRFLNHQHGGDVILICNELSNEITEKGNQEIEEMYYSSHREDIEDVENIDEIPMSKLPY